MTETETVETEATTTGTETVTEAVVDWRDGVAKEKRFSAEGKDRLERFEKPEDAAISYLELESSMGGKVKIPAEDAPEEEWTAYYDKIRPESAEKYEVERPEMPEGLPYDEELEKSIKALAHKAGLSKKQLAAMAKGYNDYVIGIFNTRIDETKRLNEERWANLKIKWGERQTTENIELAKRAFNEIAPEELKKIMNPEDVEQDPILVQMYANIWRKTLDDTLIKGKPPVKPEDYKPQYPDSPEMYRGGEDEESRKAREYFKKKGYKY